MYEKINNITETTVVTTPTSTPLKFIPYNIKFNTIHTQNLIATATPTGIVSPLSAPNFKISGYSIETVAIAIDNPIL